MKEKQTPNLILACADLRQITTFLMISGHFVFVAPSLYSKYVIGLLHVTF